MELNDLYNILLKKSDEVLERFEKHHLGSDAVDLNKLSKFLSRNGNYFEFELLGRKFVLVRDIMPYGHLVLYKTYEAVLDCDNYPNTKLNIVPDMDVLHPLEGQMRFTKDKTRNSGFNREANATYIRQFGLDYIEQLGKFIFEREQKIMKELE